jgi:hypothetical protein
MIARHGSKRGVRALAFLATCNALLACGDRFSSDPDADAPDASLVADAANAADASPFDAEASSSADGSTALTDAADAAVEGGAHVDSGCATRACAADGTWGACSQPPGACPHDTQQSCTPLCGQWPGTRSCAHDCSGYGACVTNPFSWTAHDANGGFLHQCAGAQDHFGNWQTSFAASPNNCLAQYGPYLQAPRGAYQASVEVWGNDDTVVVMVANHNGITLQSSGSHVVNGGWSTIPVPDFRIDDDACTGVELKVQWVSAGASGTAIVVGPSHLARTGP